MNGPCRVSCGLVAVARGGAKIGLGDAASGAQSAATPGVLFGVPLVLVIKAVRAAPWPFL